MSNGVIRKRQKGYTQVSNYALRDNMLSLKAKGLYSIINSFLDIPDFVLYRNHLLKQSTDGETAFRAAWKELKDVGYLIQTRINIAGKFAYEYELLDEPEIEKPSVGNPPAEKPHDRKSTGAKPTSYNKKDFNNKDLNNKKRNKLPQESNYEQRKYDDKFYNSLYDNL